MKRQELQIAPWAREEKRQLAFKEMQTGFFSHVRFIFVLLFFAAIIVFATNNRENIQQVAFKGVNHVLKNPGAVSDRLRDNALNHEQEINDINQQPARQP